MNLTRRILLALGCVILLATCKKDKPTPSNYISFKVNGVYSKLGPEADYFDDQTFLLDAGPSMKGEIALYLDTNVMLKTFNLQGAEDNAICDYYNTSGTHFWSDSGAMVVSAYDGNNISGTFSFRGVTLYGKPDTIRVTEGQFSAKVSNVSFAPDTCTMCDSLLYNSISKRHLMNRFLQKRRSLPWVIGGKKSER